MPKGLDATRFWLVVLWCPGSYPLTQAVRGGMARGRRLLSSICFLFHRLCGAKSDLVPDLSI